MTDDIAIVGWANSTFGKLEAADVEDLVALVAAPEVGVVRPFVILYRYDRAGDVVEILRILDGRRDLKPRLLPP